jgi:hypothetical protein
MDETAVASYILDTFEGVETAESYGYTFFFYGADRMLPFATMAASDNEHDSVSNLSRPGVFRLNLGVSPRTFEALFGTRKVDLDSCDFTALDTIMPHPDYAPQHFVCVLSPDQTWAQVQALLAEAYELAVRRDARRGAGRA